jgi:hypothetical protein
MYSDETMTKILAFWLWVGYQTARLSLGLVSHPYKTVREIMRGRWFVPLLFLPSAILLWIFVSGRVAAWVVDVPQFSRDVLGIFYSTLILSLGFWQGLLWYLGFRFGRGLRQRK